MLCPQDVHSESLQVLGRLEVWADLDWSGLRDVQLLLPPVRERLIDMSHLLSHRWSCLDNTQRLLTTLTEVHTLLYMHYNVYPILYTIHTNTGCLIA